MPDAATRLREALTAASEAIGRARNLAPQMGAPARVEPSVPVDYRAWVDASWPNVGGTAVNGVSGPYGPHGVMGYDWRGRTRSGGHATTPGTFWRWGKLILTADHVVEEMFGARPPFARRLPLLRRPGGYDAAIFGTDMDTPLPPEPVEGSDVLIEGVTGGTYELQVTPGKIFMNRPDDPGVEGDETVIVRQRDGTPLVEKGRSGGRVGLVQYGDFPAIGITAIQSAGNVDSDGDGDKDRHMDFVPLRPVIVAAREIWSRAVA